MINLDLTLEHELSLIDLELYNHNLTADQQSAKWVEQYCHEVLTNKIVAGELIKLACLRHLKDLKRTTEDPEFKWQFSLKHAQHFIDFYQLLSHVKTTTGTFKLMPWQIFIVGSIFGWVSRYKDQKAGKRLRRFREANVFVARKNGKSTLACGIALAMMFWDQEIGPDIFTAAPSGNQSKIVFTDAMKMLKKSALRLLVKPRMTQFEITSESNNSSFRYLNSNADNLDGLNSHCAIIDEIHGFKNSEVYDVMKTSVGSRDNSLFMCISTAGTNISGIGHQVFDTNAAILRGTHEADRVFCALYTIDKDDDYRSYTTWQKANPGLGGARADDDLYQMADEVQRRPTARSNFFTKYLNVFVQGTDQWLTAEHISASRELMYINSFSKHNTSEYECFIGVDLASVQDMSALSYVFKNTETDELKVFTKALFPRDNLDALDKDLMNQYVFFHNQRDGSFELTEGSTCDYEFIKEQLFNDCKLFDVKSIELDPYQSRQLHQQLVDLGLPAVLRSQGMANLNEASRDFERRLIDGSLKHHGSKVFEWCCINAQIKETTSGLINVVQENKHSSKKIDCLKAAITAIAGTIFYEKPQESGWSKHKPTVIRRNK